MKQAVIFFAILLSFTFIKAHPGIGIVMDSKGNLYYTDLTHVWKISANGRHTIAVKNVHTHQLFIDQDDNLYGEHVWYEGEATDKWGYFVWCLSKDGDLKHIIPRMEGFPTNNTLVRDFEGNMYYQEKSGEYEILKKKSTTGETQLHTNHKFEDIRWMHIPEGEMDIYVVDYLTVKKISANGAVEIITDNLREKGPSHESVANHHYLMGIWTDTMENIYVAAYGARKVKKITPDGHIETVLESPENWSPSGGLVASDGSIWLLEFSVKNKTRVSRIMPDDREIIYQAE